MTLEKTLDGSDQTVQSELYPPEVVIDAALRACGLQGQMADIVGNGQRAELVEARRLIHLLLRNHTLLSYAQIAALTGRRSHVSVMYSCRRMRSLMDSLTHEGQDARSLYRIAKSILAKHDRASDDASSTEGTS